MSRILISDGSSGFDQQIRDAVDALSDEERAEFNSVFPDYDALMKSVTPPLTAFYPESVGLDPDYPMWIMEWIEKVTDMFWSDGDLWKGDMEEEWME